jgi:hypothetical protein
MNEKILLNFLSIFISFDLMNKNLILIYIISKNLFTSTTKIKWKIVESFKFSIKVLYCQL